jgi:addiction module RelE/StbE family toxin
MYQIFKRDYKKLSSDKKSILTKIINKLANSEILAIKYQDHKLTRNYIGCREC